MARPVVPVGQIARRIPTAGRIRIGVRVPGRGGMTSIDTFRFTSQDRAALEQIAGLYGGEVRPWSDPKAAPGQFEVVTEANVIRVALPPDPLGGTPSYELWSGGGRVRNCDGVTCEMLVQGADGIELQQCDCICYRKNVLECQLITRLSVLLPEVRFVGVWRIDTRSQNAAEELPGMVDLIRSLQDRGIVRGLLRIESRRQVVAGQTRQFRVPVLGIDESVEALASGRSQLGYLGTGSSAAGELGAGSSEGEGHPGDGTVDGGDAGEASTVASPSDLDDEVVDAELVDRTLADLLPEGVSEGRALAVARRVSDTLGLDLPTACSQVTDERVIEAVLDEVAG